MSQSHDGFLVKQHRPLYKWVIVFILLVLLVVAFFVGRWDQERALEQTYDLLQDMDETIQALTRRNEELVKKNARLLGDSKVERDAYKAANNSLIELQKEILLQKEELFFYRSIVSPSQSSYGVNLQEFALTQRTKEGRYHYKVVLTKTGKSNYAIKGEVIISVKGLVDGENKTLLLSDIVDDTVGKLKYSFRYFQIFEGDMELPEKFYPESVTVRIKSKTKKVKSVEDSFNWAELTSGEA